VQLIGLDVGFSATKPTSGVATLVDKLCIVGRATAVAADRQKLLTRVSKAEIAAIDAPLLPLFDSRIRACERLFARGLFQRRCKPGFSHVAGTGLELRRSGIESAAQLAPVVSVERFSTAFPQVIRQRNIVEAFPNAFLGVCIADEHYSSMLVLRRGQKFDWLYDRWCRDDIFRKLVAGLTQVLPESVAVTCGNNRDHEERAALVCLATAGCVAAGRYTAVGEEIGGYFFLPPWSLWADWSREELRRQRDVDGSIDVWIDGVVHRSGKVLPSAV
jgi:hypothetical protein